VARLAIWVKPGARTDALTWDPWRDRWVVSCRDPAVGGAANRAVLALFARWLDLSPSAVRWDRSGRSRAKTLEVLVLSDSELQRRLQALADAAGNGRPARRP
jgi:uncharacterized protein YggU (UPF0235/DUF167 family)